MKKRAKDLSEIVNSKIKHQYTHLQVKAGVKKQHSLRQSPRKDEKNTSLTDCPLQARALNALASASQFKPYSTDPRSFVGSSLESERK